MPIAAIISDIRLSLLIYGIHAGAGIILARSEGLAYLTAEPLLSSLIRLHILLFDIYAMLMLIITRDRCFFPRRHY